MHKITIISALMIIKMSLGQQIVFTAKNISDEDIFWKVSATNPSSMVNLTESINQRALFPGKNKGPITTSHNGAFFVFQSERFDDNIEGYEAITLSNSELTDFEVPKDAVGTAFHAEGIMQISNDGRTIIFVQGGGKHNRDIYKITKGATAWSDPVELTTGSAFAYNLAPYLSYDESKIIFEGSNSPSFSTALMQISLTGTGLATKTSTAAISASVQIKSPCYDANGNIFFEAETDAERVWKIPAAGGTPTAVQAGFTNDNSPISLPDGRIASLYLPASTHQIKIMDGNGSNESLITQESANFTEVLDIGISAGASSGNGILGGDKTLSPLKLRKVAARGMYEITSDILFEELSLFNTFGFEVRIARIGRSQFQVPALARGLFLLRVKNVQGEYYFKTFVMD